MRLLLVFLLFLPPLASFAADEKAEWMFVQSAQSGSTDGDRLILEGVSPRTVAFTDRPDRRVAAVGTDRFVAAIWKSGGDSFAGSPPNAVLAYESDGEIVNVVVEFIDADFDEGDVTYTLRYLQGELPPKIGPVDIFIDDAVLGGDLPNSLRG